MTINGSTISGAWVINTLVFIVLAVIGWNATREFSRNDDQEQRIRAVEQACVEVKIMRADMVEIKSDLKTLLRKTP